MSAQRATAEVISELTELTTTSRGGIDPHRLGLEAALHGRAAALELAYRIASDIDGTTGGSRARSIYELTRSRPGYALVNTLAQRSRPPLSRSPMEIVAASAPGSLTRRWERLGATATAALVHWTKAVERPKGQQAVGALVDAATITLHTARLDKQLRVLAERLGQRNLAAHLRPNDVAKMHFCANQVLRAGQEFGPEAWDARAMPDATTLVIIPVTDGRLLPAALTRLGDQLRTTESLPPHDLTLLLGSQARMSLLLADQAAEGFSNSGDLRLEHLSAAMKGHARRLGNLVWPSDDQLHGLMPSDDRMLMQAGSSQQFMSNIREARWPAALTLGRLITDLVPAMSGAVDRSIHRGHWAVLSHLPWSPQTPPQWEVSGPFLRPPIADRLARLPIPRLDPTAPRPVLPRGVGRHRERIKL